MRIPNAFAPSCIGAFVHFCIHALIVCRYASLELLEPVEDDVDLFGRRADLAGFFKSVDGSNMRMVERCENLGFAPEARHAIVVGRKRRRQDLDGHVAAKAHVPGAIDSPMPPTPMASPISYGPIFVPGVTVTVIDAM